jgi:hypothetical protein
MIPIGERGRDQIIKVKTQFSPATEELRKLINIKQVRTAQLIRYARNKVLEFLYFFLICFYMIYTTGLPGA